LNTKAGVAVHKSLIKRFFACHRAIAATGGSILLLILLAGASICPADEGKARHHLQVELLPEKQMLQAVDEITIEKSAGDSLNFKLSRRAEHIQVTVNGQNSEFNFENGHLQVELAAGETNRKIRITIRYAAIFDDPVPIRPVNADNPGYGVSATISERGSFLLSGSGWYPQWVDGHSGYTLKVIAPHGMLAVTAGQSKGHVTRNGKTESTWVIRDPIRGLSLSVGPYTVREKKIGSITAATYFFPETDHLAEAYLAATAIAARGRFSVALAGGSTPRGMYMLLSARDQSPDIDWQRVHVSA
jgi:hypothetical protein